MIKSSTPRKSRTFSWTLNNYADKTDTLDNILCSEYKYLGYGKEIGEQGTPHLQGIVTFENPRSLNSVIKLFKGCHVEVAHSAEKLLEYCKKDGDYTEKGTQPISKQEQG